MRWRDDIQALRALAVCMVVLFHLGLLPGGFLGVDVFFVISGYLIGSHILTDTQLVSFSLRRFYARRLRRLIPTFAAVSLATLAAAWWVDDPLEFEDFGKALTSASLMGGNIYFYRSIDYFHQVGTHNPLLHYWSLGVEEQFYFVFPAALMILLKRSTRAAGQVIAVTAGLSLIASAIATHLHPAAAFYLLPFRMFEFAIGVLLAFPGWPEPRGRQGNIAALGGVAVVIGSSTMLARSGGFPGALAALPCLGAAAFLWAGHVRLPVISVWFCRRPIVWLGRISYSLYMVHWPIVVFTGSALRHVPGPIRIGIQLLGMLGAAALSFYAIEEPLRRVRRGISVASLCSLAGLATLGLLIANHQGYPSRFSGLMARYLAYEAYDPRGQFRTRRCFLELDREPARLDIQTCLPSPAAGQKLAVLWGDSTAADLWVGLHEPMARHGYVLGQVTAASCPPAPGYAPPDHPLCPAFNASAFDLILRRRPALVLLSWAGAQTALPGLATGLAELRAAGVRVILIGVTPLYDRPVPRILADRITQSNQSMMSEHDLVDWSLPGDGWRRYFATQNAVGFASITEQLCPDGQCPLVTPGGIPMEFDPLHFTTAGSRLVGNILSKAIFQDNNTGAEPAR